MLLLLTGGAHASIGVISLEELSGRADLIVHGRVASVDHIVSERDTAAGTLQILSAIVHIEPHGILKGRTATPIVVTAIENMEDSPGFKQGQEVVLFLKQNMEDSRFSVFGLTRENSMLRRGRLFGNSALSINFCNGARTDPYAGGALNPAQQHNKEYHLLRLAWSK